MGDDRVPDLFVENRQSLATQVYRTILSAIMDGVLAPGARLIETELTARLDVSRTPLREALNRLATEGLLTRLKGGGYEVATCSLGEITDIFDTRLVLERYLFELVVERIKPQEITELRAHHETAERAAARGDLEQEVEADDDFHRTLQRASRNAKLAEILVGLERHAVLFRTHALWSEQDRVRTREDHAASIEAIERRSLDLALRIVESHINHSREVVLRSLRPHQ